MSVHFHKTVADFSFLKPDGATVRLSEVPGRPLLVVFLRHLA
jgi:hypothetical protein